jgi:hypothetical protein
MATDTEKAAVRKLEHVSPDEAVVFTAEEVVVLRRMIRIMRGLDALGWLGGGVRNVVLWAGGMYLAYWAFADWIFKAMGKK